MKAVQEAGVLIAATRAPAGEPCSHTRAAVDLTIADCRYTVWYCPLCDHTYWDVDGVATTAEQVLEAVRGHRRVIRQREA